MKKSFFYFNILRIINKFCLFLCLTYNQYFINHYVVVIKFNFISEQPSETYCVCGGGQAAGQAS